MEINRAYILSEALEMYKTFSLLLPSKDFKHWEGAINAKGSEIFVSIDSPNFPFANDVSVVSHCPMSLISCILNKDRYKRDAMKLTDFLKSFTDVNMLPKLVKVGKVFDLMTCYGSDDSIGDGWLHRYEFVLKEINSIGAENVIDVDGRLMNLSITKEDENGHIHQLDISVPHNYPSTKPSILFADLPDVVLSELYLSNTILELHTNFISVISKLQCFWEIYSQLRQSAWVIDPEKPSKRDTYCRIVIGDNISVLVTINPLDVRSFPDIKFLGPENSVSYFRKQLEYNLKECGWDMNNDDVVGNLLTVLGLERFPSKTSIGNCSSQPDPALSGDVGTKLITNNINDDVDMLVDDQECCICFLMRTEDSLLPTKICNNNKCTSVVHLSCLAQWFQCVPTNEPSFNLISGDCPNCGKRILCPLNQSS